MSSKEVDLPLVGDVIVDGKPEPPDPQPAEWVARDRARMGTIPGSAASAARTTKEGGST